MVTINKFKNKLFRSIGLLFVTLSLLLLIFPSTALATTYEQYGTTSMISNCDTLTGWSKSTLGTMAIDNALYLQGNGSVKLTSTNTSAIYGEFDNSNFNCSGKFVALSIYIDNVTALGDFRFYIFNNTAYTSFAYYSYPTNRLSNGWNNITLPLGRSAWTYSNFTDADFGVFAILRVRFYAIDNTSTVAINVDNILSVANTFSTGKVTFSFDDCINTTYATAKPLMDAFGYAGIAFVPTSYVGGSGRMTLANLLEMQSAGWDISSHSVNHVDLTALTTATLISELADSRSWLANNGFPNGSRFLANPFYHTNTTVQSYVSQYFNMSRPWDSTFESLPPCDWNGVRCYATTNTTTASTLTSLIANATYFGDWLIINMHTTTTGDLSQSTYMTNTTLQTVLQYCHDNSVNVILLCKLFSNTATITASM